ncbi:MAG: hypothetical protein JW763_02540 [candidate division Zixibacteria bacterium]|nr:hypothetical protein [candidate division Zixibacteria bacterium]
MKRMLFYSLLLLSFGGIVLATPDAGLESPFAFGAGARDLALGGANLAVSSIYAAPYWNASRLATAERPTLGVLHSNLYESDVAYQYLGLVYPSMDWGVFGLGVFRLGVDGIERRDNNNAHLGDISDSRLAFYLAYGRTVSNYDLGLAVTFEHHSLDEYNNTSSPGVNLSLGRRLAIPWANLPELDAAISGRNLLKPSLQLDQESVEYPLAIDAGLSLKFVPCIRWQQFATLSVKVTKVDYLDAVAAVGLEYSIENMVHLRGGYRDNRPAFGVGLTYKMFTVDYALVDRDMGSLHLISLTTAFGKTVEERRRQRLENREEQFNTLMNDRLDERNQTMVRELTTRGEHLLDDGDLVEAANCFDRALFLAYANNVDTTAIVRFRQMTQERLTDVNRKYRYRQYTDSARVSLQAGDFLATCYFAGLALAEIPDSPDATRLYAAADSALSQSKEQDEIVHSGLNTADSLLSYGSIEKAITVLQTLKEFAPNTEEVQRMLLRAEFEFWRRKASEAFEMYNLADADRALDSALTRFPGQQWCLNMKRRIETESSKPTGTEIVEKASVPQISPDVLREVAAAYEEGRHRFEKGDLQGAIAQWEKVERLSPQYQAVREYLVNAYKFVGVELYGQNRLADAVAVWQKAADLNPDNNEIKSYIKRTQNEIKRLEELSYDGE